jgi:rhomboid protease GluP
VTVLVFILQAASQYILNGVDVPAGLGMKVNSLILDGQLWRLITPMFLHGSILHLGFNMYALYIFGPGLERHYGHWRFLLLYFLSGFAGNVMSFLFSASPSLGSSTAIFGLLGAEGVFLYQNRGIFGSTAQRALGNIITIAVINLVIGLSPGIDNWGHIGGLLGGTLFAWSAGPRLRVEGIYPAVSVIDDRETGDVLRAGIGVGLLFALLAAATIYIRN